MQLHAFDGRKKGLFIDEIEPDVSQLEKLVAFLVQFY